MGKELEWQLVPGGLYGCSEFRRKVLNSGEERVKFTGHEDALSAILVSEQTLRKYFEVSRNFFEPRGGPFWGSRRHV